jgi:hypothetical protein
MSNNRKGMELTMNTIVIAAIAILILAILAFFIIKGFKGFSTGTQCETNSGQCIPFTDPCPSNTPVISGYGCKETNKKCCTSEGLVS